MNAKIFSRRQKEEKVEQVENIVCNETVKQEITEWLENVGWKESDFSILLEQLGIEQPVTLHKENEQILCMTSSGEELTLKMLWCRDEERADSDFYVTKENEMKVYSLRQKRAGRELEMDLIAKVTEKENRRLENYYDAQFIKKELQFGDYLLIVQIDEPEAPGKEEAILLQKDAEMEAYLWQLDGELDIEVIYDSIMKILNFEVGMIQYIPEALFLLWKGRQVIGEISW